MKVNKAKLNLKARLEKIGYRVYFTKDNKVKLSYPSSASFGCHIYTFREAYNLAKCMTGDGKSTKGYNNSLKHETKRTIRAHIRNQINTGKDDIHFTRKLASDPWRWD
jgi:hypothetical protein